MSTAMKEATDIHSCSLYCDRPECIKAQRDELRDKMLAAPKGEAVASIYISHHKAGENFDVDYWGSLPAGSHTLYTRPAPAEPQAVDAEWLERREQAAYEAGKQAVAQGWKDGDTAKLVNDLRDVAVQFHAAEQLRERIAHVIRPLTYRLSASPASPVAAKPDERVATAGELVSREIAARRNVAEPEQRKQSEMYRELVQSKLASKPEPQAQAGEPEAWGIWLDGEPPHPWREEWFVAETIYGDLVVLQALEQPHSYDYTTADRTYMKAKNVKRWMQFPESEYTSYATKMHREAIAKKDAALLACVDAMKEADEAMYSPRVQTQLVAKVHLDRAITQAQEARK